MWIFLWDTAPSKIFIGSSEVASVWAWDTKVRPTIQPITTPWIYHSADLWLISISSDWSTRYTVADKNLWATTVYNDWDTVSEANAWKFYQRWNNYWFPRSWATTTSSTTVSTSGYWPWNYYSSSTFILAYNWFTDNNANLRWGTTWTVEAMRWPCNEWFHIPSDSEWQNLFNVGNTLWAWGSWWWKGAWIRIYLKMPEAWYLARNSGQLVAGIWFVRASTYTSNKWYWLTYNRNSVFVDTSATAIWQIIRPFKNVAVQPRSWNWTKLY